MPIRWRGLELPSQVELDSSVSTDRYGRFIIEPFERGFGITIGNSLRRVLLSSLEGGAVTTVKIAGVSHEFSTIPGVLEDVTDIILNVKSLVVGLDSDTPKTMTVSRNSKGEVRASDVVADPAITIVNQDQLLATLTEDVEFRMDMILRTGRGYATAEENAAAEQEIGVIPIESVFSPVERVRYKTEETRVGQQTNYDRLILEVWTKGTVNPEDAVVEASKILRKHLNPFVQYHELGQELVVEPPEVLPVKPAHVAEIEAKLARPVADLELSVRAGNCLEAARVRTVGELVRKTEAELLRVRSFGRTSLREVRRKLSDWGLTLGMTGVEDGEIGAMSAPAPVEDTADDIEVRQQFGNINFQSVE
ncbi:MAG: DNA-directed RNA polymerase subunit alpha [Phycisphaerae bacterium]|nr:DNA-directed RNA polymerase subunit alpha [Phycisphaerae bacterium]